MTTPNPTATTGETEMTATTKKSAYEAGSRAAAKKIAYGENPYIAECDADLRLAWSQGHNTYRANKARVWVR